MSYKKYVNGLGYTAKSHNVNVCKIAKELYYNEGISNCKTIATMLGYSQGGQVMTIKKYILINNCDKCGQRRRNPKNYIVWY